MEVAHTKRRRLVKILAGFAALCGIGLVLSHHLLHPYTLRGRFDRIRLGMSEAEALQVLGEPDETVHPVGPPRHMEQHSSRDGGKAFVLITHADCASFHRPDPFTALTVKKVWWELNSEGGPAPYIERRSAQGIIFLDLDQHRRVTHKTWVDHQRPSIWARLRAWLGWQ
jgi:hypothetical protein